MLTASDIARLADQHITESRKLGREVDAGEAVRDVMRAVEAEEASVGEGAASGHLQGVHRHPQSDACIDVSFAESLALPDDVLVVPNSERERLLKMYPFDRDAAWVKGAEAWWLERHVRLSIRTELLSLAELIRDAVRAFSAPVAPDLAALLDGQLSATELASDARAFPVGDPESSVRAALSRLRPEASHYLEKIPRLA